MSERRWFCGGMRCPGLGWVACRDVPHPRTCLCQPRSWPGMAAASMGHTPPADRDPSVQAGDPDPNGLGHQARIEVLAKAIGDRPSWMPEGLFSAGLFAALRSVARRSPELAQVAREEAESWALVLQPEECSP
jgi:hypothetical protein